MKKIDIMVWFFFFVVTVNLKIGVEFKISYTSQNEIQKGNVCDRFPFIAV